MSTGIGWTDETWNFVLGCDKATRGCDSCYAIRLANIRASNPTPTIAAAYADLTHRGPNGVDWTGAVRYLPERLTKPLRWRKPRRIFVNSMADLFHPRTPYRAIVDGWAVMAIAHWHQFQVLTKRHARLRSVLSKPTFPGDVAAAVERLTTGKPRWRREAYSGSASRWTWPLPNVWVGVSVEDQETAALRIPALLDTPAAVRWISAEPLLGPVNLAQAACRGDERGHGLTAYSVHAGGCCDTAARRMDWVVVGGETAPVRETEDGALISPRPMHPDWVRSLRDQCADARVAFFMKQWGDVAPEGQVPVAALTARSASHAWYVAPDGSTRTARWGARGQSATVQRVGSKAAGNAIDGRVIEQYPEVAHV